MGFPEAYFASGPVGDTSVVVVFSSPEGIVRSAASHLGLFCLQMSNK